MRRSRRKREQEAAEPFTLPSRLSSGGSLTGLASMQHSAGNQAVNQLLASEFSLLGPNVSAPTISRFNRGIVATFYFGKNLFLLDSRNLEALEKLGDELRLMTISAIAVDGYASAEGTADYNLKLSVNRRQTIMALLRSKLNEAATFNGEAHGDALAEEEERGKASAELEGQRALNRRVTVVILPTTTAKAPTATEPVKPIDLRYRPLIKPETDNERAQRELLEAMKRGPLPPRQQTSFTDEFWKVVDEKVEAVSRKVGVPENYRGWVRDGAHALIEKGLEKTLDQAMSESNLNQQQKEMIKSVVKAAAQSKFEK